MALDIESIPIGLPSESKVHARVVVSAGTVVDNGVVDTLNIAICE